MEIDCPSLRAQLSIGDSVAVNGVCLTVAQLNEEGFTADLLDETLAVSTLGMLPDGSRLNLEPAMRVGDRIGGHNISGHVEDRGLIRQRIWRNGGDCELSVAIPPELNNYMIHKGSIAIDGVSLTIHELHEDGLVVKLIPETLEATNLGQLNEGDSVNIETDLLVKTIHHSVERILQARDTRTERNDK